jgi:hypothetical protein
MVCMESQTTAKSGKSPDRISVALELLSFLAYCVSYPRFNLRETEGAEGHDAL